MTKIGIKVEGGKKNRIIGNVGYGVDTMVILKNTEDNLVKDNESYARNPISVETVISKESKRKVTLFEKFQKQPKWLIILEVIAAISTVIGAIFAILQYIK